MAGPVAPLRIATGSFAPWRAACLAASLVCAALGAGPSTAQNAAQADAQLFGAVILNYHRFGENDIPATNIRLEQFDAHLAALKSGNFTVMTLGAISEALRTGKPLPDRTVSITIDDGYLSTYTEAWPRLKAAGFPFTLFISTDYIDGRQRGYMTWDQIREMVAGGAEIGGHGAAHAHYPEMTQEQMRQDIEKSNRRYQQELGKTPTVFAYPFGEMSIQSRDVLRSAGYVAAYGQHSGVAEPGLDMFYQPRFALNEDFGAQARFQQVINAQPMGARDIAPEDPVLNRTNNPPAFGFTVVEGVRNIEQINCFASHEAQPARIERLGRRIEVRVDTPFPVGRGRFNCTVRGDGDRWRWFGFQFLVPAR